MYQHHIILCTQQAMPSDMIAKWYDFVKTYGPDDIVYPYTTIDGDVAIEYGIRDGDMQHCYIIPLARDLTTDETQFIVATWEHVFVEDFDIEISNQYEVSRNYEYDINEEFETRARHDMKKWHHNRWVTEMSHGGWNWGTSFSESKKTHPALRDWDSLPESHRRSPEFNQKEITEWIRNLI
jgi:hypothetical protein